MAEWIAKLTGIKPAFLLAVLTQESNLGKNVGTCNRLGDPPTKSWKVVMKPDREPFLTITKELGLDPTSPRLVPLRDKTANNSAGAAPWVRRNYSFHLDGLQKASLI